MKFVIANGTEVAWIKTAKEVASNNGLVLSKNLNNQWEIVIPTKELPFPFLNRSKISISFDDRPSYNLARFTCFKESSVEIWKELPTIENPSFYDVLNKYIQKGQAIAEKIDSETVALSEEYLSNTEILEKAKKEQERLNYAGLALVKSIVKGTV
jgi:hypothetical protein